MRASICSSLSPSPCTILASAISEEFGRTGFGLWDFVLAGPKAHRPKPVLPKSPDAVGFKDRVVTDDRHVFRLRLSDQHAVEWILMQPRQKTSPNAMLRGNRQQLEPLALDPAREVGHEVGDLAQFSL